MYSPTLVKIRAIHIREFQDYVLRANFKFTDFFWHFILFNLEKMNLINIFIDMFLIL
jgi:hypothetical protein